MNFTLCFYRSVGLAKSKVMYRHLRTPLINMSRRQQKICFTFPLSSICLSFLTNNWKWLVLPWHSFPSCNQAAGCSRDFRKSWHTRTQLWAVHQIQWWIQWSPKTEGPNKQKSPKMKLLEAVTPCC